MAERFLREEPAQRAPRVAKRHHAKRSGHTPRVTISAKRKYITVAKRKYITVAKRKYVTVAKRKYVTVFTGSSTKYGAP